MKCVICSEEVKAEKEIMLKYVMFGNEKIFCSVSCLLKFLADAAPKSFKITPTEIALLSEKTRKVWKA